MDIRNKINVSCDVETWKNLKKRSRLNLNLMSPFINQRKPEISGMTVLEWKSLALSLWIIWPKIVATLKSNGLSWICPRICFCAEKNPPWLVQLTWPPIGWIMEGMAKVKRMVLQAVQSVNMEWSHTSISWNRGHMTNNTSKDQATVYCS